jgi:hypothetical protein
MRSFALFGTLAASALVGCAHPNVPVAAPTVEAQSQGTRDAELAADFGRRTARYMQLHDKIQKQGTRQKQGRDIGENLVSQQALALRLRFARHDARPGDLFTPSIAVALRRALDPEVRGLAALRVRQSIREDAPATFVLVVNGSFPEGAPRSTMPGNVLRVLPTLPHGLEYRIVDTHLVLIDLDADIVVDYMLDIMCQSC